MCLDPQVMGEAHTDLRKEATDMSHELSMGFLVKGKGTELLGKRNTTYIHSWCDVRKLYKHMMDEGFCTICKDPEFVYEESHCLYNPMTWGWDSDLQSYSIGRGLDC